MRFRGRPETVHAMQLKADHDSIVSAMLMAFGGEREDYNTPEMVAGVISHGGIYIPASGDGLDLVPFGHWLVVRSDESVQGMVPEEFHRRFFPAAQPPC
ncbi:hypothetical protein V8N76_004567 [Salmonella enterica]